MAGDIPRLQGASEDLRMAGFILSLVDRPRPRVCLVPTADGDGPAGIAAFYRTCAQLAHGLDEILREAHAAGVVLCGVSAGMNCWFEASVTDSFDLASLAPLHDGLGLLPGSACPHYDGEPLRRPSYRALVADEFPAGYAADDAAGLHFEAGELREVVSTQEGARAYRVDAEGERALPARLL